MLFKSSNNVGLPSKENFSKAFPEAHFGCLLLSGNYTEKVSITLSGILRLFNWIKTSVEGRANFHTGIRFNLMIVLASLKLILDLIVNLIDWAIKPNLTFHVSICNYSKQQCWHERGQTDTDELWVGEKFAIKKVGPKLRNFLSSSHAWTLDTLRHA